MRTKEIENRCLSVLKWYSDADEGARSLALDVLGIVWKTNFMETLHKVSEINDEEIRNEFKEKAKAHF